MNQSFSFYWLYLRSLFGNRLNYISTVNLTSNIIFLITWLNFRILNYLGLTYINAVNTIYFLYYIIINAGRIYWRSVFINFLNIDNISTVSLWTSNIWILLSRINSHHFLNVLIIKWYAINNIFIYNIIYSGWSYEINF